MRRTGIVRNGLNRFSLLGRGRLGLTAVLLVLVHAAVASAAEKIAIFPATPYDGYIVYKSLAVFWIAIIGLIVIIRMKLREIERIQALGADREEKDAPLLQ